MHNHSSISSINLKAMKPLLFFFAFFFAGIFSAAAQNDAITRFFNQYAEDERFTVVYIAPKLFQLVAKVETDDEDWNNIRQVVKDLGGLRVLAADSIANGLEMYKSALSKVPAGEYSELLTVRDKDENVRIWTKDSGNIIEELLLLVGKPDATQEEIEHAFRFLYERTKLACEPAGAAAAAAWLSGKVQAERPVIVVSGGNVSAQTASAILARP